MRNPVLLPAQPLCFAPDTTGTAPTGALHSPGTAARDAAIVAGVIAVHAALLAVLVLAPHRPAADVVIPAMVVSESVESSTPAPQPESPAPQPLPTPVPRTTPKKPEPIPSPAQTQAPSVEAAPPAPPASSAFAPSTASASAVTAAPVPRPASPRIELPNSSAAYLNNPAPEYPRLSRRLNEQGKVILRVLIGVEGIASQAEISASSGYERLDQAALQAVRRWKYVPGTRNGVPEAMWFNVPVLFVLE